MKCQSCRVEEALHFGFAVAALALAIAGAVAEDDLAHRVASLEPMDSCLEDASCRRMLREAIGNATGNSTEGLRTFDLSEPFPMTEIAEPGSQVDLGPLSERDTTIFVAAWNIVRGVFTGKTDAQGEQIFGFWDYAIITKVAALAFANGLVITPPGQRAPFKYHLLFADVCKDRMNLPNSTKCQSPYMMDLAQTLLFGGCAHGVDNPPARVAVGSYAAKYLSLLAGARGLPNVGHGDPSSELSVKWRYPSFARTNPTDELRFTVMLAVIKHFNYTLADLIVCDISNPHVVYGPTMSAFSESGVEMAMLIVNDDPYTVWPAGHKNDFWGDEGAWRAKQQQWELHVSSMLARNAHVHIQAMISVCPVWDWLHYVAMHGLAGGGHLWMGMELTELSLRYYEQDYFAGITLVSQHAFGEVSPYTYYKPMDGHLGFTGDLNLDGPRAQEFWELMRYIGEHQDELLEPWLRDRIPASEFSPVRVWGAPSSFYLFDAIFTALLAVNSVLLEVGGSFTNEQLMREIWRTDFVGLTGRVMFDQVGDRLQVMKVVQYNLDPDVQQIQFGMKGELRVVAEYLTSLELVAPFTFYESLTTPPPDKDLNCDAGMMYNRTTGRCLECSSGKYTHRAGLASCEECQPGTYTAARKSSSCLACDLGFVAAAAGSTECVGCAPGSFNGELQQSACSQCESGSYSVANSSKCSLCPRGTFAQGRGNAECEPCLEPLTTRFIGSESPEVCLCPADTYRSAAERTRCLPCPGGMQCDLGADEAMLPRAAAGDCGEACSIPSARPGFMTLSEQPLRAFRCLSSTACPGGAPGSCGARRDSSKVACALCEEGAYRDGIRCSPCSGGVDLIALILAAAMAFAALVATVFVVNRDLILQTNSMLSVSIIFSITLTSIQAMGVFDSLALDWFEPLKSVFQAVSLIGFDLEMLKLSCFFEPDPTTMFLCRQLVAPVLAALLFVITLLRKRFVKPGLDLFSEYTNSLGTIFSALFISMATSSALPLICYRHPDSTESMLRAPSVLCWESSDHTFTVAIGLGSFLLCVLPFISLVAYGTAKHKSFVAESTGGASWGLLAFRFLFFRFREEAYYYGALLMVRSLLICLVPVVIRHDAALQICTMGLLLLLGSVAQLQLQPWKNWLTNLADGLMTSCMILILLCGTASADFGGEKESIGMLGSCVFALLVSCSLAGAGIGVWRRLRPSPWFQWFICHHKRDAAAAARMLKIVLQQRGQSCFIDSDDLQDLDTLFDIVRSSLEHLVVYLTRDVLTRPWCAGEIATATAKGMKITGVETAGFAAPEEHVLTDLANYLDLSSTTLSQYSITFEAVACAYRHLLWGSVPKIKVPVELRGRAKFQHVAQCLVHRPVGKATQVAKPGAVVISSDPGDDEATAAAGILISKVQGVLFGFMDEGVFMLADEPGLLSGNLDVPAVVCSARAVVVVLSKGSLECKEQLQVIVTSTSRLASIRSSSAPAEGGMNTKSSNAPKDNYEVIPVNTPSFCFPGEQFYNIGLPKLWDGKLGEVTLVRSFFKRLSIAFATHASDTVLDSQASQVAGRIPRQFSALVGDVRKDDDSDSDQGSIKSGSNRSC